MTSLLISRRWFFAAHTGKSSPNVASLTADVVIRNVKAEAKTCFLVRFTLVHYDADPQLLSLVIYMAFNVMFTMTACMYT